jgi:SAM-dependent methyltransferase
VDRETAELLRRLNTDFYRVHGASFAATRTAPWPGWTRCLEEVGALCPGPDAPKTLAVLDLACGNLRFATFLERALPKTAIDYHAVDERGVEEERGVDGHAVGEEHGVDEVRAAPIAAAPAAHRPVRDPAHCSLHYQELDILGLLLDGARLGDHLTAPPCDLSVSFGFMHHIPQRACREAALAGLVEQTRPGGLVIVSLWRFMDDEGLAQRARAIQERALRELGLAAASAPTAGGRAAAGAPAAADTPDAPTAARTLDENDYLLGWQGIPGAYRYCHSFTDDEIDQLATSIVTRAPVVARFEADGRTGALNTYLVLQVPTQDGWRGGQRAAP